jgi:hypothetical protein
VRNEVRAFPRQRQSAGGGARHGPCAAGLDRKTAPAGSTATALMSGRAGDGRIIYNRTIYGRCGDGLSGTAKSAAALSPGATAGARRPARAGGQGLSRSAIRRSASRANSPQARFGALALSGSLPCCPRLPGGPWAAARQRSGARCCAAPRRLAMPGASRRSRRCGAPRCRRGLCHANRTAARGRRACARAPLPVLRPFLAPLSCTEAATAAPCAGGIGDALARGEYGFEAPPRQARVALRTTRRQTPGAAPC